MAAERTVGQILIVDDDPFILRTTAFALRNIGYRYVITAEDVAQAQRVLVQPDHRIEILITDINMPYTNGIEFLRQLADTEFEGGIVLISGEDNRTLQTAEKLAKVRQLNVLGAVSKPIQIAQLKQLLQGWPKPQKNKTGNGVKLDVISPKHLATAIETGQLEPWFQPKVALASGKLVGVEVLARWPNPVGGMIYPNQFIPVAEAHGLINPLTMLMLNKSLLQVERWRNHGLEVVMALNISMNSLADFTTTDKLISTLQSSDVHESDVIIEVTESGLMLDLASPLDNLVRLRLKKVRLSIDDFGTGHSSLEQLRDLPFDELKLDRSFVHGAAKNETIQVILESSVELAKRLDMTIVAEGVENEEDWRHVTALGCDYAQGYFIGRPMPGDEIEDWLKLWKYRSRALIASQ